MGRDNGHRLGDCQDCGARQDSVGHRGATDRGLPVEHSQGSARAGRGRPLRIVTVGDPNRGLFPFACLLWSSRCAHRSQEAYTHKMKSASAELFALNKNHSFFLLVDDGDKEALAWGSEYAASPARL
eukprot:2067826-Prymnesium_polylepis.2